MAYVQPNSVLQLFKGINLDNRYLHTIYFASESAQNTWFTSKVTSALTFNALMYRRYTSNAVKIEADATSLLGVTYMRFKNTRSGAKWFYAFVLNVDYVNENTSIVYYEIDVMQTWFMQGGSVRPCMVLREHVNDDTFGTNLEEEPVGSDIYDADELQGNGGTYDCNDWTGHNLFNKYYLIANTNEKSSDTADDRYVNNNLVNGTSFWTVMLDWSNPTTTEDNINQFIDNLVDRMNGNWEDGLRPVEVIDMFTFPTAFSSRTSAHNFHQLTITHNGSMGGYIPKNHKLWGYPYSFLELTTKNGDGCTYKWEYFDGILRTRMTENFVAYGNPIGGGQIQCYPRDYNGIAYNLDAGFTMNDFPKNPFSYDAYQAWVASGGQIRLEREKQLNNIRGVIGILQGSLSATEGVFGGAAEVLSGGMDIANDKNPMGAAGSIISGASRAERGLLNYANTLVNIREAKDKISYKFKDARYQPNIVVGAATPNLNVATGELNFYFYHVHVRKDELTRLDDFFSCYGYAINKVKAPNLTGRQYWNYVQTQNAVIAGDMPSSSKEAIGRIFDGGITFWHNGDQVGNYRQSVSNDSINNPIVT